MFLVTPDFGMFRFLRFFDWFFDLRDKIVFLFESLFESIATITGVIGYTPAFIGSICIAMLSIALIMWVVNLF